VFGAALLLCGCDRAVPRHHYTLIAGTISAIHDDTGQITLRPTSESGAPPASQSIDCVITKDSEIYVNDRFSALADLAIGDPIEIIGYGDPNPRLEAFVTSYVYLTRPVAPPAAPLNLWEPRASAETGGD
jgi:hypothetical protein